MYYYIFTLGPCWRRKNVILHFDVVLNLRRIEGAKKGKNVLLQKCTPPPLKKGQNVLQRGEGSKPEKYVHSTCYFFFSPISPPPQFSKILLKWGGGESKKVLYCNILTSPPPNRVTKGVVIFISHTSIFALWCFCKGHQTHTSPPWWSATSWSLPFL